MAELRAYNPTWRDKLAGWMMGDERATPERRRFVEGLLGSSGLGSTGFGVVDATPVGGLLGAQEAAQQGDYRGAAMNAMFVGPAAKTANQAALKTAKDMAAKGAGRDAIWNETGWFKGVDDKWRFEIPDNKSKIGDKAADDLFGADGSKAQSIQSNAPGVLWHDDLYQAYPDLRRVQIEATRDPESLTLQGYFSNKTGTPQIGMSASSLGEMRSGILHEMQHGVQRAEGFASGGGPMDFMQQKEAEIARDALWWRRELESRGLKPGENSKLADDAIIKELNDWGAGDMVPSPTVRQVAHDILGNPQNQLDEITKFYGLDRSVTPLSGRELYKRMAGEVEARNVQKRMDMTPDERRATPPWATQDVPDELQIIRGLLSDR